MLGSERRPGLTAIVLLLSAASGFTQTMNPTTTLWYQHPAQKWEEALPVGNGRVAAGLCVLAAAAPFRSGAPRICARANLRPT